MSELEHQLGFVADDSSQLFLAFTCNNAIFYEALKQWPSFRSALDPLTREGSKLYVHAAWKDNLFDAFLYAIRQLKMQEAGLSMQTDKRYWRICELLSIVKTLCILGTSLGDTMHDGL